MIERITTLAFLGFLLFCDSSGAQSSASYRVVVNSSSSVSSLTMARLSELFLKKVTRWDKDTEVLPVDQPARSPVREDFSQEVHGRPVRAIRSYWQSELFAGRTIPPPELASEDDILTYVRSNPGAIGYVSKGAALGDGVKAVTVTD